MKTFGEKFFHQTLILEAMEACFEKLFKDLEAEEEELLVKKVGILKKNWIRVYAKKVCSKDDRFLSHGDLWMNNIMFNQDKSESKIIDWQTMAHDHPVIDVSTIIFTSLMPDKIECWNTALLKNYIDKFHSTCTEFEVEPPFEFAELKSLVFSSGIISRGGKIV